MNLSVLYRGPLSSCNYGCHYCPFSKRTETETQLERDRKSIAKFVARLSSLPHHEWKVLLTPWGEALVRHWYRQGVTRLTHVPHVMSVAIQTNLSCGLGWLAGCRTERLSLWATFHPTETTVGAFVRKVQQARDRGVRVSAGVVGVPEFLDEILKLRRSLPEEVYLWINAQQPRPRPYTSAQVALLTSIDPQFPVTLHRQKSRGKPCRAGELSFTVDGRGNMRRCHFVDEVIGDFHAADWEQALQPRQCPNRFCDCFLGKAQLLNDALLPFFGTTLLERLPVDPLPVIELPLPESSRS